MLSQNVRLDVGHHSIFVFSQKSLFLKRAAFLAMIIFNMSLLTARLPLPTHIKGTLHGLLVIRTSQHEL